MPYVRIDGLFRYEEPPKQAAPTDIFDPDYPTMSEAECAASPDGHVKKPKHWRRSWYHEDGGPWMYRCRRCGATMEYNKCVDELT